MNNQRTGRPKKSSSVDLAEAHDLTAGLIERLTCPEGKSQAFLRDRRSPALRVRVTAAGAKAYVFEAKLDRQNDPQNHWRCPLLDHRGRAHRGESPARSR